MGLTFKEGAATWTPAPFAGVKLGRSTQGNL